MRSPGDPKLSRGRGGRWRGEREAFILLTLYLGLPDAEYFYVARVLMATLYILLCTLPSEFGPLCKAWLRAYDTARISRAAAVRPTPCQCTKYKLSSIESQMESIKK